MNIATIPDEILLTARRRTSFLERLWRHRWFGLFVVLPTLVALIYYGLIASDVYVSQSRFVIKSPGQKTTPSLTIASLVQAGGATGAEEQTREVLEYLRSRDALHDIQKDLPLRQMYSDRGADFLSRFPRPFRDRSFENLYSYYRSMVSADQDAESNLAVLETHAFTPRDAYAINERLLTLGEQLVNKLNERSEQNVIREAQQRVQQAEVRVRNARVALSAYRNQEQILDPTKQASGVLDVSDKLVSEYAALQAQLNTMIRETPRHPAIPALRSRVAAVAQQIAVQNSRAVGSPSAIASKLSRYEALEVEQEFATGMLTAANTALEQARTDAQKQQFYLERVVEPNTPDDPSLPKRLSHILTIFAASLCLYFIGWMIIVGILEHAPED